MYTAVVALIVSRPWLQGQQDQIKEVTTRNNKTTTKLEVTLGQLDKATREIKDLREAAQVCIPIWAHMGHIEKAVGCRDAPGMRRAR